MIKNENNSRSVSVIVAHPDDETLWAGGTILSKPFWDWNIVTLCRASDANRAPKFHRALQIFGAMGRMGDMDDGPKQKPLRESEVSETILNLVPSSHYNLIITHSPFGEYTRHIRHEETGRAVISLWQKGRLSCDKLWLFAYEDAGKEYNPKPIKSAHIYHELSNDVWLKKYSIINQIYGFEKNSFEAETTPHAESFWRFTNPNDAQLWLKTGGKLS